jgi:GNAT superfamily N-acetyltransferase
MTPEKSLVDRVLDTNLAMLALGCEVEHAEEARWVWNSETPNRWDSNHVSHVRISEAEEIDALLERAREKYAATGMLSFEVDYRTPAELEARLALEGFWTDVDLMMVLEGDLVGEANPFEVRPVDDEKAWAEYEKLHALDWGSRHEKTEGEDEAALAHEMFRATKLNSPPARFWLAYVEGHARSYFFSWEGVDGVGQVESLFTHPGFRHRGLATALIHHCVADARAHGAGPVVIVADAADTPKEMYAAMGFRPIAVKRTYRKRM